MWIIYRAEIEGKYYIGITSKSLDWRRRRHQVEARRGLTQTVFHNKLAKHMHHTKWEVLIEVESRLSASDLEKEYIERYNSRFPNGYNLTDGGEGIEGFRHTDAAKEKIRKAHLGRRHSTKSKKLMSKNRRGISTGAQSLSTRNQHALRRGTPYFDVFTRDGQYVGTWCNKSECSRQLGIGRTSVISGLRLRQPTCRAKFIFKVKNAKI